MASKTLLLVEDDQGERRLLLHGLKDAYRVLEAAGVEEAVEHLAAESIDLVLLDLHLRPGRPGPPAGVALYKLLAEAKPLLPVVVLTADSDPAVETELRGRGVFAFLHKPADPVCIRTALARALETSPDRPTPD